MCIFCKIVNKEIPANIVYEDEYTLAFLDLAQSTKGHTLVIPKKHYCDIFELDEDISNKLFSTVVKVSKLLKEKLVCKGINILNNNREIAGQVVFHYHIHLLPRYSEDDTLTLTHKDNSKNLKKEDYSEILNEILKK